MSSFLLNKYTRWYNTIVEHRRSNLAEGYVERHHILPKSMGGSNLDDNLVALTAREHFVCHWLLTKMTVGTDRTKMLRAFNAFKMSSRKNPRRLTARQYAIARNIKIPYEPRVVNPETGRKISKALTGRTQSAESNARRSASLKNRTFTDDHIQKLSVALKGRTSPTKGMKFEGRSFSKLTCPCCGKEISKNNMPQHIKRHDAYRSSVPSIAMS